MPASALATSAEVAEYLTIPESTVGALARRGDLPYVWLGNRRIRRFRLADLDAFIASRSSTVPHDNEPAANRLEVPTAAAGPRDDAIARS